MESNARTGRRHAARCAGIVLRCYLALFLAGCAGTRPPSVQEARKMETRTLDAGFFSTIRAITNVLQDQGYTVDAAQAETGIMTASRESSTELAKISDESEADHDGIPVWAKVLLVVTLVPVIILLIAHSSDSSDDSNTGSSASLDVGSSHSLSWRYRISFNIEPQGPGKTRVRMSAQGIRHRGDETEKAGPIHDPAFFQRFFDGIQVSLPATPESTPGTDE